VGGPKAVSRSVRVGGRLFHVHPSPDYVSDHMARGTWWESAIVQWLVEHPRLRSGGLVIDAGAMIGTYAVPLAENLPVHVHAFEPMPGNLRLLRMNTAHLPNVTIHPVALSDHVGTVSMAYEDANRGHAAVVATDPYPQPGMVAFDAHTDTVDRMDLHHVALIKADVEWHEAELLRGAARTIDRDRPIIVLEDWEGRYGPVLAAMGYAPSRAWPEHLTQAWEPV
jgi:FkbM family methyltransferase